MKERDISVKRPTEVREIIPLLTKVNKLGLDGFEFESFYEDQFDLTWHFTFKSQIEMEHPDSSGGSK